jgi:hypothetical protein
MEKALTGPSIAKFEDLTDIYMPLDSFRFLTVVKEL